MKALPKLFTVPFLGIGLLLGGFISQTLAQTDLDYYSLQLTNRARTNPFGENFIQGTSYGEGAATPLAYNPHLGDAAENHTEWMYGNRANTNITNGASLRSLGHYESSTAGSGGTPLPGSPGYTGFSAGDRINNAGYARNSWGENIVFYRSTAASAFELDIAQTAADHAAWWNSSTHRSNMMNTNFRVYGHYHSDYEITDVTNTNLPAGTQSIYLGTQTYASPGSGPNSYLFGLAYNDLDSNGDWTMRADGDPMREGLAGFHFSVQDAMTSVEIVTGTTYENGAFSAQVDAGTYDVIFDIDGFDYTLEDVVVNLNANTDLGEIAFAIPEPTTTALLGLGIAAVAWRRRSRS